MLLTDVPFLNTMSYGINFVTVEHILTCTSKKLSKYLKQVMPIYCRSGMIIQDVLMDIEFERTIDKLRVDVFVDTSTTKEHIIEI